MKHILICVSVVLTALTAAGCAKTISSGTNDQTQRYYNAWVKVKQEAHPEYLWLPISYGTAATSTTEQADYAYLLSETEGDGAEVFDTAFVFLEYTTYDLAGSVQTTTDRIVSQKTGVNYDPTYYYGPTTLVNLDYYASVGLKDVFDGVKDGKETYGKMKVGGSRMVVVPGWLSTETRYDGISDYLDNVTGTDLIYDIKLTGLTDDIEKYQIDSIESYFTRHYGLSDSAYTGFYYKVLDAPATDKVLPGDTTIYINYVGRLLNGQVFDTNIADTAKMWNLYDASSSYEPVEINWSTDSTSVTMDDEDVITGFASIITRMNYLETAVGAFYSNLGYGSSGSGYTIPPYAPLEFEVRIVEN